MEPFLHQLTQVVGAQVPNVVGAMLLLVLGWIVAQIVAGLGKKIMYQTTVDQRLAGIFYPGEPTKSADIQQWFGKGIFYLLMMLVLIAVFETLQLSQVNEPLNRLLTDVFQFFPRILSAGILVGVAWIVATILRVAIQRGLTAARFDERVNLQQKSTGQKKSSPSMMIGDTVYWLVFLLFLPGILGALAVEGLLDPVKGMTDTLLGFVPNVFAAGLILLVGYFVAGLVQRIVTNFLEAVGTDSLSERVGLSNILGSQGLSHVIGLIVYALIFIPVIIGALNALKLEAITLPASNMLNSMLGLLPDLFGATLMVTLAFVVGRVFAGLVANLLAGIGFNNVFVKVGLTTSNQTGTKTPSEVVGTLTFVTILLFAVIEAADLLGLQVLANLIAELTVFGGHLLVGLVVFTIGLYLANVAAKAIQASSMAQAALLAKAARLGVIVLATAMALRQMGLADEIVNLAFGLTLGSLAIAFALALGLGGREVAATELKLWMEQVKTKSGKAS